MSSNNIQRKFIPGDEWLYFKIYSGPRTLESVLINEIFNLVNAFLEQKIIDKFFFIRYSDPHYHLRIRFHLLNNNEISDLINCLNKDLKPYIEQGLIWKICIDVYCREIERYGKKAIDKIESLFFIDSKAISYFLRVIRKDVDDSNRWLWGIRCMNRLLEEFGLSLKDKILFFEKLSTDYSNEFNISKKTRVQLDRKYRDNLLQMQKAILYDEYNDFKGEEYIIWFQKEIRSIIQVLPNPLENGMMNNYQFDLLYSLVHMHFNRLFRTKQRLYEFVIYFFLHKLYKSESFRQCHMSKVKII